MNMAFGESIRLCRVYEKTSKSGNKYFAGRLAGAKIAIMLSKDVADDGGAIWDIVLSQAIDRANGHANVTVGNANGIAAPPRSGGFDKQLDDEIPF
jgi:hypothetical protein